VKLQQQGVFPDGMQFLRVGQSLAAAGILPGLQPLAGEVVQLHQGLRGVGAAVKLQI
jgi:hypothetical protein